MSSSSLCDQLAAYVDGELEAAEADAFAVHLASCQSCAPALHELLQLVALEAMARSRPSARESADEPSPAALGSAANDKVADRAAAVADGAARADELAARRRRRGALVAVGAAVAAGVAGLWLISRGGEPGRAGRADQPLVLATAETRSIEGRISYPAADRHRPYDVARSGAAAGAPADAVPLATLSKLEDKGDVHGVAAAFLLMNDAARAQAYLDRAAAGRAAPEVAADIASDRALIQLTTGHPVEALITLDGALAVAPRHPQALWNRALVLRALELQLSAAAAFDAVAALGEPGWADEARQRASALTDQMNERKAAFTRLATIDGPRLTADPRAVTLEVARQFPGMTRLMFYDAVRSAESADAVRALGPLAAALDAGYGGHVLASYLERIARANFAVRAPLAHRYAQLVAGQQLDGAAARQLFAQLRAAGQDDLLFGALFLANAEPMPSSAALELSRIADSLRDPWFHLFAIEQLAASRVADGDHAAAEALILPALAECAHGGIDYRCANLDLVLGNSYLLSLRLPDAQRVLADGWTRARRGNEWNLEKHFAAALARLESLQDDVAGSTLPLVRAYASELLLRDPGPCDLAAWAAERIALVLVNRVDLEGARTELARAAAIEKTCPAAQPDISSVFVKAHVLRDPASGSPAEVAAVRAEIAALRTSSASIAGEQAMLDQTEGRLLIDRDRPAGTALLERAISISRSARASDAQASKARSYAYSILTLDAGRAGEWDQVWKLLGDEAGFAPPARCTVGIAVEDRTSVVVVRDLTGASRGAFDAARSGPAIDAPSLIPAALRAALRDCPQVKVVARPPVQGLPSLLPADVAWSYQLAAERDDRAVAGRRLVISGAQPPPVLGLQPLNPWRSTSQPDVVLEGAAATPSRVLAELEHAGTAEIHAHGMVDAAQSDASFVMLSPEPDGQYMLTAGAVRKRVLRGHPIVILAACQAGVVATYRHETWSLPAAFIAAGARAVIASSDIISDADAGAFFDDLRARIERGAPPVIAMRDARRAWLSAHPTATWVQSLMIFQ